MEAKIKSKPEGAELTSIIYNGKERLHDAETVWKRHSPILFPIVGKLLQDKTKIKENIFEMTQHGFARDMTFEIIENTENIQSYFLKSNEETKKKYPYDFMLVVTHYVEEEKVTTEYHVMNMGEEKMPFGIGGHPAYQLDYTKCYIEFEKEENQVTRYHLEDGIIAKQEQENLGKQVILQEDSFDKDAIIWKGLKSSKLWVKEKENNKIILEFSFEGFPYLAIWSKREAPFLCIEPWYSVADRKDSNGIFEEKEGTIFLQPKEEFICSYSVKFQK